MLESPGRFLLLVLLVSSPSLAGSEQRWLRSWSTALQIVEPDNLPPPPGFPGRALRQEIQLTLGGEHVRVSLANTFGEAALPIAEAWIAPSAGAGRIRTELAHRLAFAGATSAVIAPGASLVSDAVPIPVAALDRLAVTLRLDAVPATITGHPGSRTGSFLADSAHATAAALPADATRVERWYFLSAIEVLAPADARAVVVLGDSIADGRGSTIDGHDRWPDQLARRLSVAPATARIAVLNHGIGGNRVLRDGLGPPALARLDRDVLSVPGVRWLIVHAGVNDLGAGASADELIAAYRQIIRRAHAHGIRVFGATILPFGASFYDKPANEIQRQSLNRWIREGGEFDRVIDFDATARDPQNPARLDPAFDGGDHLHPSAEGYRRLAESIDLTIFNTEPPIKTQGARGLSRGPR